MSEPYSFMEDPSYFFVSESAYTVKGWQHFVEICNEIDRVKPVEPSYAFRGQSNSAWQLRPKLLRKIREIGLHENPSLKVEKLALETFRAQAHLHISPNILLKTTTIIDWWALMQHHGAPTRLLDWTYSPYVAAYNSAIAHPDKDGLVWYVDTKHVKGVMTERYGISSLPINGILIAENHFSRRCRQRYCLEMPEFGPIRSSSSFNLQKPISSDASCTTAVRDRQKSYASNAVRVVS